MLKKEIQLLLVVLVVLLCSPRGVDKLFAQGGVSFRPPVTFGNDRLRDPREVIVSDFAGRGEGFQDLAVANFGSDTVTILLGNGDGTFRDAQNFPAGSGPISLDSADLNGGGFVDLVVADWNTANVSVLMGFGDGTFQEPQSFMTGGSGPRSVTIGNFHGENMPLDLAVVNFNTNNMSVLLGNGDGTFQPARLNAVGNSPRSIALGGLHTVPTPEQDLAAANFDSNTVSIMLGNGNGTFRSAGNLPVGTNPVAVAIADFNGDKLQDVATANFGSNNVSILLRNSAEGTFGPAQSFDAGPVPASIAVADFDGDGILDLAVANWGTADNPGTTVSILLGIGDGTFQKPQSFDVGGRPIFIAVGDFNRDGRPDLAVLNTGSTNLTILINNTGE